MYPTLILKTAPNESPYGEVDITGKTLVKEEPPLDLDFFVSGWQGDAKKLRRAMKRRLSIKAINLTNTQIETIRRWIFMRKRVRLNGNYNANTILYQCFRHASAIDSNPGVQIGPTPTFTRTVSDSANVTATYTDEDNIIRPVTDNVPRYERRGTDWKKSAILLEGKRYNNLPQSHPTSGNLIWTLVNNSGNANLSWEGDVKSNYNDELGVAQFWGDSGDYIYRSVGSVGGFATYFTFFVWLRGRGQFELEINAGATGAPISGGIVTLSPDQWTQLKVEGFDKTGAHIIRLYSRETTSWCYIAGAQHQNGKHASSYIHTTNGGNISADRLHYDVQLPSLEGTVFVAYNVPSLGTEDRYLLNLDMGGGAEFLLMYQGSSQKYYFQKKLSSYNVSANAVTSSGNDAIIAASYKRDQYALWEDAAQQGTTTIPLALVYTLSKGLVVGSQDYTVYDHYGLLSTLHWVRIDRKAYDATEHNNEMKYYADDDTRYWTELCEGRDFIIKNAKFEIKGGVHRLAFILEQVYGYETAVTEEK